VMTIQRGSGVTSWPCSRARRTLSSRKLARPSKSSAEDQFLLALPNEIAALATKVLLVLDDLHDPRPSQFQAACLLPIRRPPSPNELTQRECRSG
jgi:hypothetical protein